MIEFFPNYNKSISFSSHALQPLKMPSNQNSFDVLKRIGLGIEIHIFTTELENEHWKTNKYSVYGILRQQKNTYLKPNTVLRPILTYGALVRWSVLKKQYNIRKLNGIQRAPCVGVTGAIKSCPTDALNMLLHQLHIAVFPRKIEGSSVIIYNYIHIIRLCPSN